MEAGVRAYRSATRRELRDKLILENLGYVRHVLGKIVSELPPGVDTENLEGAGTLGLVEAASQFDPERGVAFTTFAFARIRGAILDELRRNCPVSQQMISRWSELRKAYRQITPPVTVESLAEKTGLSVGEVEECLSAIRMSRPESWYDELRDQIPARNEQGPSWQIEFRERLDSLATAIERLSKQQRLVVTMYYVEDLRLKEIGEVLGLSESRISRILTRALLHLKEIMAHEA